MSSWYELRTMNKLSQYGIKENAQNMLKAHEDWKTHKIDEAELGRRIRLSPENRAAVIQTMVKIAGIMHKKPEESKYVLAIIEACGEIVTIADNAPASVGFPGFLKLPSEIRHRVYEFYLKPGPYGTSSLMAYVKKGDCSCAAHDQRGGVYKRNISLAFISKQMRDEVLTHFLHRNMIHFSCAREMAVYLRNDAFLRAHIRKVKFLWCGKRADKGIIELQKCAIENLVVVISKTTFKEPSKRENELRAVFPRLRNKASFPEALGFEELSAMRGLSLRIECASKKRSSDTCSAEERYSLEVWLQKQMSRIDD